VKGTSTVQILRRARLQGRAGSGESVAVAGGEERSQSAGVMCRVHGKRGRAGIERDAQLGRAGGPRAARSPVRAGAGRGSGCASERGEEPATAEWRKADWRDSLPLMGEGEISKQSKTRRRPNADATARGWQADLQRQAQRSAKWEVARRKLDAAKGSEVEGRRDGSGVAHATLKRVRHAVPRMRRQSLAKSGASAGRGGSGGA